MNTRKEDILDQMPPDFRLPEVEISKTCQRMAVASSRRITKTTIFVGNETSVHFSQV